MLTSSPSCLKQYPTSFQYMEEWRSHYLYQRPHEASTLGGSQWEESTAERLPKYTVHWRILAALDEALELTVYYSAMKTRKISEWLR